MRLNRREFIGFAAAGAAGAAGAGLPALARRARPPVLDYWCTWSAQAALRAGADGWKPQLPRFPGDQGMPGVRDNLDEEVLFGPRGLANLYPESRSRLNFVIDDGWDVPYGADPSKGDDFRFSSLEPDPVRFPSLKGTPGERLKALADRVRGAGWAGLGLWVACQASGKDLWEGAADDPRVRDQIKRKLDWCAEAGVAYWKVDWGRHVWSPAFRAMMSDLRDAAYPALVIEHCRSFSNALNGRIGAHRRAEGSWDVTGPDGRMIGNPEYEAVKKDIRAILAASDVFRTYDVVNPLSLATTLERAAWTCALADELAARVVINVEDELYVAAALGFAMGVMRHPIPRQPAVSLPGDDAHRLAEVRRAAAWRALSPAFGSDRGAKLAFSDETIAESYHFRPGDTWWNVVENGTFEQRAPARMARGCPLPDVTRRGDGVPFVLASRNPVTGVIAVAALPVLTATGGRRTPPADVVLDVAADAAAQLAVFGELASLRLRASRSPARVTVADLAGGEPHDMTGLCSFDGGWLRLPGDRLSQIGAARNGTGDLSSPGALVRVS